MKKEKNNKNTTSPKPYLPNERGYFNQEPSVIRSYSENDSIILPDPVSDPIVVNNIAWMEFDYTSPSVADTDLHSSNNQANSKSKKNNHKK
ncbi:MAG: hypothetical protein AB6733_14425 [Clostridiaceae bacterium]